MQAEINASGDPSGGQHVAVVNNQRARLDGQRGVLACELKAQRPVGCDGPAVEQARLGKGERSEQIETIRALRMAPDLSIRKVAGSRRVVAAPA